MFTLYKYHAFNLNKPIIFLRMRVKSLSLRAVLQQSFVVARFQVLPVTIKTMIRFFFNNRFVNQIIRLHAQYVVTFHLPGAQGFVCGSGSGGLYVAWRTK